jgi:hypothetical protein
VTEWRYRFAATPTGTRATEDYVQIRASLPLRISQKITGRAETVEAGMRETLSRLKAAAEGEAAEIAPGQRANSSAE